MSTHLTSETRKDFTSQCSTKINFDLLNSRKNNLLTEEEKLSSYHNGIVIYWRLDQKVNKEPL